MEYGRTEQQLIDDSESIKYGQQQAPYSGNVLPPLPSAAFSSGNVQRVDKKYIDDIVVEKQNLEQDLMERDNEIYRLQAQLKGIVRNAKSIFEGEMDNFI